MASTSAGCGPSSGAPAKSSGPEHASGPTGSPATGTRSTRFATRRSCPHLRPLPRGPPAISERLERLRARLALTSLSGTMKQGSGWQPEHRAVQVHAPGRQEHSTQSAGTTGQATAPADEARTAVADHCHPHHEVTRLPYQAPVTS